MNPLGSPVVHGKVDGIFLVLVEWHSVHLWNAAPIGKSGQSVPIIYLANRGKESIYNRSYQSIRVLLMTSVYASCKAGPRLPDLCTMFPPLSM
jgi:hypothetical protein